ncbi:MAG: cyclodeaminase/cyclohydrolase family protein [Pseudonocardiaceae bacterium]
MRNETIRVFLELLAARVPAPGGGASAAVNAAQAAALLGMVARYSDGAKYEQHADLIASVIVNTDELRERALGLVVADAAAFTSVTDAYQLPKDTDELKAVRSAAIAEALTAAAEPPAGVVDTASRLIELAEALLPVGNPNVITDVAAAAEAARAAATTARVNIEVNLSGIRDPSVAAELTRVAALVDGIAVRAEQVTAAVRRKITQ